MHYKIKYININYVYFSVSGEINFLLLYTFFLFSKFPTIDETLKGILKIMSINKEPQKELSII